MQESQSPITEEERKDLEKRSQAFQVELNHLTKKFKIVPLTQAVLTPDGRMTARLVFADLDQFEEQQRKAQEAAGNTPLGKDAPDNGIATPE